VWRINSAARQAARFSVDSRSSRRTLSLIVVVERRTYTTEVGSNVQFAFAEALDFGNSSSRPGLCRGAGGDGRRLFDHWSKPFSCGCRRSGLYAHHPGNELHPGIDCAVGRRSTGNGLQERSGTDRGDSGRSDHRPRRRHRQREHGWQGSSERGIYCQSAANANRRLERHAPRRQRCNSRGNKLSGN